MRVLESNRWKPYDQINLNIGNHIWRTQNERTYTKNKLFYYIMVGMRCLGALKDLKLKFVFRIEDVLIDSIRDSMIKNA